MGLVECECILEKNRWGWGPEGGDIGRSACGSREDLARFDRRRKNSDTAYYITETAELLGLAAERVLGGGGCHERTTRARTLAGVLLP
jgi:hypothetical protein